ncbi:MAG: metallophosphoesterase, partial [Thermoprotei archaeon]
MVRILSTADIHSPRYLDLFMKSLERTNISPDIIVLAGDLVDKNNVYALKPVYNALLKKFPEAPI